MQANGATFKAMANYYVSGIWSGKDKIISHLLVHVVSPTGTFGVGKRMTIGALVTQLRLPRNAARTMQWSYDRATWTIGPEIDVVENKKGAYLRTKQDAGTAGNLDNVMNLGGIYQ